MIPLNVKTDHDYSVIEVEGDKQGLANAFNWCCTTFGPPGTRWFFQNNKFYFMNERDYIFFELRW